MGLTPKFKSTLPTKEEFKQYVLADLGGLVPMNDIASVMSHTGLSPRKIIYIREHYKELKMRFRLFQKQNEKK